MAFLFFLFLFNAVNFHNNLVLENKLTTSFCGRNIAFFVVLMSNIGIMHVLQERTYTMNNTIAERTGYEGLDFKAKLEKSRQFVEEICNYFVGTCVSVSPENDKRPFYKPDGDEFRLADIRAINMRTHKNYDIEAKDCCRCHCFDATGLPKRYVDEKLRLLRNGEDVFLLFRENWSFIKGRAERRNISEEVVAEGLEREGLVKRLPDASLYFVPYGHRLSVLMEKENMRIDLESRVRSHFKNYFNECQYLWKTSCMLTIKDLIKQEMI